MLFKFINFLLFVKVNLISKKSNLFVKIFAGLLFNEILFIAVHFEFIIHLIFPHEDFSTFNLFNSLYFFLCFCHLLPQNTHPLNFTDRRYKKIYLSSIIGLPSRDNFGIFPNIEGGWGVVFLIPKPLLS